MVKVQHANKFALPDVSTRGNYVGSLESAAIPLQIFSESLCEAIKSYNFSTSGHHQRMVVVESNPVVWIRLKKLILEGNLNLSENKMCPQ